MQAFTARGCLAGGWNGESSHQPGAVWGHCRRLSIWIDINKQLWISNYNGVEKSASMTWYSYSIQNYICFFGKNGIEYFLNRMTLILTPWFWHHKDWLNSRGRSATGRSAVLDFGGRSSEDFFGLSMFKFVVLYKNCLSWAYINIG